MNATEVAVVSKATDISDSLARRKPVSDQLGTVEVVEKDYIIAEFPDCRHFLLSSKTVSRSLAAHVCSKQRRRESVFNSKWEKRRGTVKGWHHPVWKPSSLQWRHLQTDWKRGRWRLRWTADGIAALLYASRLPDFFLSSSSTFSLAVLCFVLMTCFSSVLFSTLLHSFHRPVHQLHFS